MDKVLTAQHEDPSSDSLDPYKSHVLQGTSVTPALKDLKNSGTSQNSSNDKLHFVRDQ